MAVDIKNCAFSFKGERNVKKRHGKIFLSKQEIGQVECKINLVNNSEYEKN